jgi:sulfotransferase
MKKFFFLSGLPRSGSTLLAAILSQNPEIFVTPTSPLLDILNYTERSWNAIPQSKAWPDPQQLPNIYKGIIHSIFSHIDRPIIIDKHRGWTKNLKAIEQIFGYKPKILCTARDISEILASYITLVRRARDQGRSNFVDDLLKKKNWNPTDENICRALWQEVSIGESHESIKRAVALDKECIHFVEYRDLINNAEEAVERIYEFLQIPSFRHRFDSIANPVGEHDEFWGFQGLHEIRPKLQRTSAPAQEVLGDHIFNQFHNRGLEFWRN